MGVYNASWSRNWGFVPLTEAEFVHAAEQLRPLLAHSRKGHWWLRSTAGRLASVWPCWTQQVLARVRDGRLFPFGFWNLYRGLRRVDQARMMALGVRPEFRHSGIDALIISSS